MPSAIIIPVSVSIGTTTIILVSTVVQATHTSTGIGIVKSAAPSMKATAAAPGISPVVGSKGGGVPEESVTTTIVRTYTRALTVISLSGGASNSASRTVGISIK